MEDLGLNVHHQSVLVSYMKFAKYMRSQILKQIEASFQDVDTRLFDDTFTKDEVREIISDLEKIVGCDVESEMISFSHNNVLILRQLFRQAQKWYLRLEIDLSESQNQEELEMIKLLEFDESQFQARSEFRKEEETTEGSLALLKMEIDRLREENERLSNLVQDAEDMKDLYKDEKNKLGEKLLGAQKEILNYKTLMENLPESSTTDETAMKEMEKKLVEVEKMLNVNMENLEENENLKHKLKAELMSTKEKVKQVEAQLHLAEVELEKKFSETKAYANMKQILIKKNEQIKDLRQRLSAYQPDVKEDLEDEDEE